MTVAEKSTELGYSLSDLWIDNSPMMNGALDGVWNCTTVIGLIPSDANQRGSNPSYSYCSIDDDPAIVEGSTIQEVKDSAKLWIDSQIWDEVPNKDVFTPKV